MLTEGMGFLALSMETQVHVKGILRVFRLRVTTGPLLVTRSCPTPGAEGLTNSSCLWDASVPRLVSQVMTVSNHCQ